MHVGDALLKLSRREEALRQYRQALATEPEERDRKEILKRFEQLGIKP
jgi:predicted negative regulator of RcsB-dependent stress response